MKLGKRELDALACPPGRRDMLVFDDDLTGFAVRVTAAGTKTFLFQYRQGRQVRRLRLGEHGDLTPAQARRLAEEARGRVAAGYDPSGERKARIAASAEADRQRRADARADAFTLAALIEQWRDTALRDRSEGYRREAVRCLRTCLARLLDMPARRITPAMAQEAVDRIAADHPTTARRSRAYARAAFNWAVRRQLAAGNPFGAVDTDSRETSRDRVLTDAELGEAWRAAGTLGPPFGPFLRLLVLTLQRRGELAGMRWAELSDDLATWTVPAARAKNRKAHVVHLPEPARAVLAGIVRRIDPATGEPVPLVFTETGTTPVSGFSAAVLRLQRAIHAERTATASDPVPAAPSAGAKSAGKEAAAPPALGWTLHDLRRTGVTTLARLGVAPHVADRLLNHVQGAIRGVAAVYQRHEFLAERRAAAEAWAAHVLAVAGAPAVAPVPAPAPAGNVMRLARRRRSGE